MSQLSGSKFWFCLPDKHITHRRFVFGCIFSLGTNKIQEVKQQVLGNFPGCELGLNLRCCAKHYKLF